MPIRPADSAARRQAMELIEAVTEGNGIRCERILDRPEIREIALEAARWCAIIGPTSFPSKTAFLAEMRRATDKLEQPG